MKEKRRVKDTTFTDNLLDILVLEQMDIGLLGQNAARFIVPKQHAVAPFAKDERSTFAHHPADISNIPGIHHVQARGVSVTTSDDPRDVTLDGEVRGQTPIYVRTADKRLRVRIPD